MGNSNVYAWYNKGNALREQGKYKESIECYDEAIKLDPKDVDVWNAKGYALIEQGKFKESIECFDEVIKLDSKYIFALNNKALTLDLIGNIDEAEKYYSIANKIDKNETEEWVNIILNDDQIKKGKLFLSKYNKNISIEVSQIALKAVENQAKETEAKVMKTIELARKSESDVALYLRSLGFCQYLESFENFGTKSIDDILLFEEEDWMYLNVLPFHKKKILASIPKKDHTITQQQRQQNRHEPPTARISPGTRFLEIVPSSPSDQNSVINCLKNYSMKEHLPTGVIQQFQDKFEDFCKLNTPHQIERSFAMSLCWLYTTESWVYTHMNRLLRDDSSTIVELAPYMKALMESYKYLSYDQNNFHKGIVYRRTKLTEKGLDFYKQGLQFVWSSFTSTSIDFDRSNEFGFILFVIDIPDKFKEYSLCLENFSVFPTEREVLLLPNIGYRVQSVDVGPTNEYPNTSHIIKVVMSYVCVSF